MNAKVRFVFGLLAGLSPEVPPNPYGSVLPTSDIDHDYCCALSLSCSLLDLVEYQSPTCDLWRIYWLQNLWNCSNSKQTEVLKLRLDVGVLPDVPTVCYLVHIVVFTAASEADCRCKDAKLSPRATLQSSMVRNCSLGSHRVQLCGSLQAENICFFFFYFSPFGTVMYCAIRGQCKPPADIFWTIYWKWVSRPFDFPSDLSWVICSVSLNGVCDSKAKMK